MNTITAEEADALVGDSWFEGYTDSVEVYDEAASFDEFNVEARAEARDDTEFIVFRGGLTVADAMDLGSGVHSIYVVEGDLRASRLILGDAILVVRGRVQVSDWVFGPPSEGIFEAGGKQLESDANAVLAAIEAPLIALFNRSWNKYVLREAGQERDFSHLAPEILDEADKSLDDEGEELIWERVNEKRFLARLITGQPVFR